MEFWESKYREIGTAWKFSPCDSALIALDLFESNNLKDILIPGVGYGRNAKLFLDHGFNVTGIEISQTAINLSKENGLDFKIYHGSVMSMPFENKKYDGIFCYAMIHLLNKNDRRLFLRSCYDQLNFGGLLIFTVVSISSSMYGQGKKLSKNRFEIARGLNVFFYDSDSVAKEFNDFGLLEYRDIDEPIKHMEDQEPLKCKLVICKK